MSDITGDNSRGRGVFVVTTTTFALATIFVAARLISRFGIVKNKTWDDWFVILAWASPPRRSLFWIIFIAFGLSFSIDYGTSKGLGKQDVHIPQSDLPALHQAEYAFTILYNPALMATKTSILIFYLRMSRNTQNLLRIASYVTLAVVNIAGVVLTFLNVFQCRPVAAAYSPNINGKCMSIVTLFLCSAPVNIITDLAILVLPIPVLTGMRLPQRQKTVLVFAFALGIFVTIVDVVRIYYLQQASADEEIILKPTTTVTSGRLGTGVDFAWNASTALMWSAVEVNIGIICACIPTLKPLIKRILPSMITDQPRMDTHKTVSLGSELRTSDERRNLSAAAPPALSPLPEAQLADPEAEMYMMDFLTTPGMDPATVGDRVARTQTAYTHTTANSTYFGFIDMKRPKSMIKTHGMESFKYCTVVTVLFFLWGFSYGLLNTLNNEIANVTHERTAQTLSLSTAYFGGYLFGPLTVGQWILRCGGFKATFICGLCIYGAGTLMFWPAAVLTSFPGFIICTFVVGFGLSVLETAANPFLALCGPPQYAEYRLLLAQGVQGVGTILSQLLAQKVLFDDFNDNPSLIDVQWAYLAVALFTVILALFFYYMPLPEATDADLQSLAESLSIFPSQTVGSTKLPLIYTTLSLAVFTQFLYVAVQECQSIWFAPLVSSLTLSSRLIIKVSDYALLGRTTYTLGRFLFAHLCLLFPPRLLLLTTIIGGTIFAILTMSLPLDGNGISGPALVFFFFEGPAWPLIFAIGLRGMGRWTKWAASALTAAASGGCVFPFVMFAVQRINHKSIQYSFCVIVALMALGAIFPIYLSIFAEARHQVDPARLPRIGDGREDRDGRSEIPIRKLSRGFGVLFEKIHLGKASQEGLRVEHRERNVDWRGSDASQA
ncbi:major facilitator superfamily domain-containing protein [Bisporella sp. PMI_857]|nr:major facilitator superfamily domain-containing protein [Bisporella sp. PMI_857]